MYNIFCQHSGYQISEKTPPDPIQWDDPVVENLISSILKDTSLTGRRYFFGYRLKRSPTVKGFPHFFIEPDKSFDPSQKTESRLLDLIEFYNKEGGGELKDFAKKLILAKVLVPDEFSLLKCNREKCTGIGITLSNGQCCSYCGRKIGGDSRKLYHFPPMIEQIFYKPGKIVEGTIFYSLKDLVIKQNEPVMIKMNSYIRKGEGDEWREIDACIVNKNNKKVIAIHITINPTDSSEKKQLIHTLEKGIPSYFVTTGQSHSIGSIQDIISKYNNIGCVFERIDDDPNFPTNMIDKIKNDLY